MQITRGKIISPQKVVVYGPEGIGKSTFAAQFPNPVFIDTEGSTKHIDVARLPRPSSWTMLIEQVKYIKANPNICNTLNIDTADWAEQLCINELCAKSQKSGIEDFGYGKGYVYLAEEFGRLLNLLEDIIERGINVVFTAHAQVKKFEQPDEIGSYDRWELKLEKKTAPLLKEWADMVLFANFETYVVNVDGQGVTKGKNKAQGGRRVMYTSHHPCWDAKNRHDLDEKIELSFSSIAHCIPIISSSTQKQPESQAQTTNKSDNASAPKAAVSNKAENKADLNEAIAGVPVALADLMKLNGVTVDEIQKAVSSKGYYPANTPIEKYDPSFIDGVLVAAWEQVHKMIQSARANG